MPAAETSPHCPQCDQNDQVVKISHLYLLAREHKQPAQPYAPPSGKTQVTRPIHPDMVVGGLTLISVIFLINVIKTSPGTLVPMLLILAVFYAFYFFFRKKILGRFQANLDQENVFKGNIETAIGEWMKLYYCGRDKGIFNPDDPQAGLMPLEQMRAYLMRKK